MATFNGAKYLQEQLDSFVAQSRLPDELIVCDDISSDDTIGILARFSQAAPFKVVIKRNEKNMGYIRNFERALSLCTGDIIFLSDQDDVWFTNKITDMIGILSIRQDIFVLQTDMILVDQNMNPTNYTQLGNIRALGHSADTFLFGCGTAIRRAWLDLALPIPIGLVAHDNWIHRLALALGVRALNDKPLQYYRRHADNASNWVASRPSKVTEMDSFREHGFRDATVGWRLEFERVRVTRLRLAESTCVLRKLDLIDQQAVAMVALDYHMQAISHRIRIMGISRFKRLPQVLAMWSRGDYDHFSGWKSAVKDILRS